LLLQQWYFHQLLALYHSSTINYVYSLLGNN
jgi:hypothetical protein